MSGNGTAQLAQLAEKANTQQLEAELNQYKMVIQQRATGLMAEMVDALGITANLAEAGDPGAKQLLAGWINHNNLHLRRRRNSRNQTRRVFSR